jgi:hypothetical protein
VGVEKLQHITVHGCSWERSENGDYIDLFKLDALIHDCGSFMAEYLITGNHHF